MTESEITEKIIGCAIQVHRGIGPGLLESVYEECLAYELDKLSIYYERQKVMPVVYDQLRMESGYRVDLFVDHKIVTYLRLANCHLGLLINFNVTQLRNGLKRVVNGYQTVMVNRRIGEPSLLTLCLTPFLCV